MTRFTALSHWADRQSGSPWAFLLAASTVVVWLLSGPVFGFSDTWQLVINTGTTIVTFLMVFLIQHSQNIGMAAIQTKLDALVRADPVKEDNLLIGIEELTEPEIADLKAQVRDEVNEIVRRRPRDNP